MYTDLSSSKVLVMEWVDGARLNDADSLASMGLEGKQFIDTLVQCTMRQMLDNGFFHADPHAGNLLAMPNGKLCYLDFGMVCYVSMHERAILDDDDDGDGDMMIMYMTTIRSTRRMMMTMITILIMYDDDFDGMFGHTSSFIIGQLCRGLSTLQHH